MDDDRAGRHSGTKAGSPCSGSMTESPPMAAEPRYTPCMAPTIEKISAVTFRVANMTESVRFYRDALGMELLYGGEDTGFSSLRAKDAQSAILNLEQGEA